MLFTNFSLFVILNLMTLLLFRSRSRRQSNRRYSRSRSRSYSHRRKSRSRSYSPEYRRRRSQSTSPMSNRRRHAGSRVSVMRSDYRAEYCREETFCVCSHTFEMLVGHFEHIIHTVGETGLLDSSTCN